MCSGQSGREGKFPLTGSRFLPWGALLLTTFAAHGLLLLNDGLYYDDLLTYHWLKEGKWAVQFYSYNSTYRPIYALLQWMLTYLPLDINFQARVVNFLLIFVSASLVYRIGKDTGLLSSGESMLVAMFSIAYPAFQRYVSIGIIGYVFCYNLFLAGVLWDICALRASSAWKYYAYRFLSICALLFSLMHNSLLVFYFGFLLLRLFYTANLQKRGEYPPHAGYLRLDILSVLVGAGFLGVALLVNWMEITTPPLAAFRAVFLYLGLSMLLLPVLVRAENGLALFQRVVVAPGLEAVGRCVRPSQGIAWLSGGLVCLLGIGVMVLLLGGWFGVVPTPSRETSLVVGLYSVLWLIFGLMLIYSVLKPGQGAERFWQKLGRSPWLKAVQDDDRLRRVWQETLLQYFKQLIPLIPLALIPLIFWVVTRSLFPSNELWKNYYKIDLIGSIVPILQRILPMYLQNGVVYHLGNMLKVALYAAPVEFILYYFLTNRAEGQDTQFSIALRGRAALIATFLFGLVTLLLGIFPYTITSYNLEYFNKVAAVLPQHGIYTHYAQLMGLPIAVMLYALLRIVSVNARVFTRNMLFVFCVVIFAFCVQNAQSYFLWQARWVADSSLMANLADTPEFYKNYNYNIYRPIQNDLGQMTEAWYVYSALFKMVANGEESRTGLNAGAYDREPPFISADIIKVTRDDPQWFLQTQWDPLACQGYIEIYKGSAYTDPFVMSLKYYYYKFIAPQGLPRYLKSVTKVEVTHVEYEGATHCVY